MNYFSNIAVGVVPPRMMLDEATGENYMFIELANRHFLEDGETVFKGAVDISLPDAFLREEFGIPDPGTMTDASLRTSVGGAEGGRGSVDVHRNTADDAMDIEIRGVTFSRRVARVELGVVRPGAPKNVAGRRLSGKRAELSFDESRARGARVTGYRTKCVPLRTGATVVQSQSRGPIVVDDLAPGVAYECRVRAASKLGFGTWSKPVRLSRR